eukprot:TRINITY_DN11394_c0_g1_i10.p1 TRINITY_DN11394_c0_g1~~TRINITY_DN11394_c0_g1_i10.p1  ORF type:complete len:753 (+),score=237.98 TRINITY_DN11394_c0_g1_i10:1426-3684(+)
MDLHTDQDGADAAAIESAYNRVCASLKTPDQLDLVEQLKAKAIRKKTAAETRLKTAVQSQLDDVREGLDLVARCIQDTQAIGQEVDQAEELYSTCRELKAQSKKAQALSNLRLQYMGTLEQLQLIFEVPDTIAEVEDMMKEELPHWLLIHKRVAELDNCRQHVLERVDSSSAASSSAKKAVTSYFADVTRLWKQMQQAMFYEASDPIGLVNDQPNRLVTVLRVIEREEKSDVDRDSKQRKHLMQDYLARLRTRIEMKFDDLLISQNSIHGFLRKFGEFYFDDLRTARDVLTMCFPAHYDIFRFFLIQYHECLCEKADQMQSRPDIDPSEIMKLLNWVPEYNEQLKSELAVDPNELEKTLLGLGEAGLRKHYLQVLTVKLSSWIKNLVDNESKVWFKMGDEPEMPLESDGLYMTDTPVILFQMIQQQIDVAFQPGGGANFAKVLLDQCFKSLEDFLRASDDKLTIAQHVFTGDEKQEMPPALVEHLMAAVNNYLRSQTYVKQILSKIEAHYTSAAPEFKAAEQRIGQIVKGFERLGFIAIKVLEALTFEDITPLCSNLFNLKWLRSRKVFNTVLATLNDYCADYRYHLHQEHFDDLMLSMTQRIQILYLRALMQGELKIKNEEERDDFLANFEEEKNKLRNFFEQQCDVRNDAMGRDPFLPMLYTFQLLAASKSMIRITWLKLKQEYADVSYRHLHAMLLKREDFSAKELKAFIKSSILAKDVEEGILDEYTSSGPPFFEQIESGCTVNYKIE